MIEREGREKMILDDVCGLIDNNLADLIHTAITLLKIGIPVLLIIFGMLDFGKGVIAGKEDEIKSGQHMFIKRAISAFLVFFVVTIVQTVVQIADDKNSDNESDAWNCANLIMNGEKKQTLEGEDKNLQIIEQCCIEAGGQYDKNGKESLCTGWDKEKFNACVNFETTREDN